MAKRPVTKSPKTPRAPRQPRAPKTPKAPKTPRTTITITGTSGRGFAVSINKSDDFDLGNLPDYGFRSMTAQEWLSLGLGAFGTLLGAFSGNTRFRGFAESLNAFNAVFGQTRHPGPDFVPGEGGKQNPPPGYQPDLAWARAVAAHAVFNWDMPASRSYGDGDTPPDESVMRARYRDLMKAHHPDKPGGDAKTAGTINDAWDVVCEWRKWKR